MADRILLWEEDCASMGGGAWKDQIYCTRRKDGSFSLRRRLAGDEGTTSPAGITGIKSPKEFVDALFVLKLNEAKMWETAVLLQDPEANRQLKGKVREMAGIETKWQNSFTNDEILDVICSNLDRMDPRFSKSVKIYIEAGGAKVPFNE